ncbi:TIR domain-containing protein [Candidatus Woesearchaeota archaeon]|nr:TIR domain-containing protein [Candidatus Woesearchaeota archaeon]
MRNKAQVELLRYQAENENYEIEFVDTSLKRPVKGRSWKPVVGRKIENSDAVICMVGKDTHSRTAVSWEVNYAYKHDIPVIPVYIHKDNTTRMPTTITYHNDQGISWNMEEIQYHINTAS